MNNLKKIVALTCAVVMALGLVACKSGGKTGKTYTVGICQLVQHEALDAATKGFREALAEKLGDKVVFDEQNAAGDSATCSTICSTFVSSNVDLIMANATPALLAAAAATNSIPILGTSITHYATALGIEDWTGKTGMNISGVSDLAPLDEQANMIAALFPEAKTVGILYCSAEPNSKYQAEVVGDALEEKGLTIKNFTFADTNDVSSVTQTACDESDVIFIPTDNTAASCAEAIANISTAAEVPIFAGEEGLCKGCGVATLSINYYDIGWAAGLMAYEVLVNEADVSTMEIQFADKATKKFVKDRCEKFAITIPEDYEELVIG
ncbi:MAG: ABC transporter substrate-binding protein [Lachnospiraceae bacterium]